MASRRDRTRLALALGAGMAGCPGAIEDARPFREARARDATVAPDVAQDAAPVGPRCALGIDVEREIFARRCGITPCHDMATRTAGLDLASPGVAGRVFGRTALLCQRRVLASPGDPSGSVLVLKLRAMPPCGERMPLASPPLMEAEIECVRAWIAGGGATWDGGRD